MNNYNTMCLKSELFVRQFFKVYLEDRNFQEVISMLHPDITWFGSGVQELCRSYQDALSLLKEEESANIKLKILEQWYETMPMEDNKCLVFGELNMREDAKSPITMHVNTRFSMICVMEGRNIKLFHSHFSLPDENQEVDKFIPTKVVNRYNEQLEEQLKERTKLLMDKTEELEALTNNIVGGVEICELDSVYTIKYVSQGFLELTGYSKEEIDTLLNGAHLSFMYKADQEMIVNEVSEQLKEKGNFSVEYRIIRKDGEVIWVLDKGIIIHNIYGEAQIQCILTDITERKKQEDALRISEKRYEIALQTSGITMFEYNVQTGALILYDDVADMYGVPNVIENGVETFIKTGIIEPQTADDYRAMYRKIHAGEPSARCYINTRDKKDIIHYFELSLTNIFDEEGKPIRAIGVRKNVSEIISLQKEQNFGKNLIAGKTLVFEADMTNNTIDFAHESWGEYLEQQDNISFTESLQKILEHFIAPEHRELIGEKLSSENIEEAIENHNNLISFAYKRKTLSEKFSWYEATVNIVKDEVNGTVHIRFYHKDINDLKEKEQRAMEEKRLYETMIAKSKIAYEVNITQNMAIKGHESWDEVYGIEKSNNYAVMITEFSKIGTHPDDGIEFFNAFRRENVLEKFARGKRQIACQYRRMDERGEYRWASCTLHLYEDPDTSEVKGFSYVEDIDEQKKKELELLYHAEHDIMTGMYNKMTTEGKVEEYLQTKEGRAGTHAFMIVDVDYFKDINDTFGHVYGDKVLKEIAENIRVLFREQDIMGRIGGDEFAIFMKQVGNKEMVEKKADEICKKMQKEYQKDEKGCRCSVSVGIALYKEQGRTYEELYQHADDSLYVAKKKGRNCFAI